jgi:hypothetical protein
MKGVPLGRNYWQAMLEKPAINQQFSSLGLWISYEEKS